MIDAEHSAQLAPSSPLEHRATRCRPEVAEHARKLGDADVIEIAYRTRHVGSYSLRNARFRERGELRHRPLPRLRPSVEAG